MAITITPISALNKSSFLRPFGDEMVAACTSANSMVGKTIYVWLGLFVNSYDALPDLTVIPTKGWVIPFPASGTVQMGKQLIDYSYLWENIGVKLQRTGTNTMNITPYGLMTMDTNELSDNTPLDTLDILTKNSVINGTPFDNTSPSVYNSDKYLRVVVYVADGTDVEETGYTDIPITSRFAEKGLYNASPEFTNFTYLFTTLTIAGIDPGFSLNTNTQMRFKLTGTWTAGGWIAIFEINGKNNAQYYTDNNLSMVYFDGSGGISEASSDLNGIISEAAFVSVSAVTSLNGSLTTKYIDVVFDKDYFTKDKQYYIALIPVKTNDYSNTFFTDVLSVTDFVVPTYGDSLGEMSNYTFDDVPFNKCAVGVAIHERIHIPHYLDKASYDAAIITNESFGTFDNNIQGVRIFVGDMALPSGQQLDYNQVEEITDLVLVNDSEKYGAYTNLVIKPEWSGMLKYVTFEYNFSIPYSSGSDQIQEVTDLIYKQFSLLVNPYETDNSKLEVLWIMDENGNIVNKFCGADVSYLKVIFQNNEAGDYHYIFNIDGVEHDPYTAGSGDLDKITSPLVISSGLTLVAGYPDPFQALVLDAKKLIYDKEYCVEIIAIKDDHIEGTCGNEDVEVTITLLGGKQLQVDYSAVNNVKQVELTIIPYTTKPGLGQQFTKKFIFTNEQSGTTPLFVAVSGILLYTYTIVVTMKMESNCIVQGSSVFDFGVIGFSDTQTLTLEPI